MVVHQGFCKSHCMWYAVVAEILNANPGLCITLVLPTRAQATWPEAQASAGLGIFKCTQ